MIPSYVTPLTALDAALAALAALAARAARHPSPVALIAELLAMKDG